MEQQGRRGQALRLAVLLALVLGSGLGGARPAGATTDPPRYFAATGLTMAGEFTGYFDAHGGVPVFGYPISEATQENGYLVQYFERERLEYRPENAGTPFEVLLGRLGAELTAHRVADPAFQPAAPPPASIGRRYFPETRHMMGGLFAAYWESQGGLSLFGYPISEEFTENGVLTQWFERARFDTTPKTPPPMTCCWGCWAAKSPGRAAARRWMSNSPSGMGRPMIGTWWWAWPRAASPATPISCRTSFPWPARYVCR